MSPRLCFLFTILALIAPLRAQDEPVHMTPEFPFAFPLTQEGGNVTVKYPVLINPATVLKPGMVLRILYVLSLDSQNASTDLALAHHGDMEQAYTRAPAGSENHPTMPPELAHEIDGYRRTVWQVPNNFILAMAQYPTDNMNLIYSRDGGDSIDHLGDERFSFFDGLFVGLPNGKVTVIAVEKESKAARAGIKAGDEITAVGGIPTQDSLSTFAAAYATAKKTATDNEVSTTPCSSAPAAPATRTRSTSPCPPASRAASWTLRHRPLPHPQTRHAVNSPQKMRGNFDGMNGIKAGEVLIGL